MLNRMLLPGFCLLLFSVTLRADTVVLRGGERINGRVTVIDGAQVRIRTTKGLRVVHGSAVSRILYGDYQRALPKEPLPAMAIESPEKKSVAEETAIAADRARPPAAKTSEQPIDQPLAGNEIEFGSSSLFVALWRSLLQPGFGQYYQGRRDASIFWAGGISLLGGGAGAMGSAGFAVYLANLIDVFMFHPANEPAGRVATARK